MRILHVLRAPVGGLFRHVRDLASEQARRGLEVAVVCDGQARDALTDQRLQELEAELALGLHRLDMRRSIGLSDLDAARRVRMIAAGLKVDVIHGHGAKGGAYARLAMLGTSRGKGSAKVLYTPHGGSLHYAPRSIGGVVYGGLERLLLKRTDGLVFESAYARGLYRDRIGFADAPVHVVHNGLKIEDFEPASPDANAADILFVGELRWLKGVDVLIEAVALLSERTALTAVIVGDGPDRSQFEDLARARGLADRVRFLGAKPARQAFRLGRILAVPSRAESLPYVVLEAGAAGLPVVASNVGGIPEIMGGLGLPLVPPGSTEALAGALESALGSPALAQKGARALKERLETRFTVASMADGVEAAYAAAGAKARKVLLSVPN